MIDWIIGIGLLVGFGIFYRARTRKNKKSKYIAVSTLRGTKLENEILALINDERDLLGMKPLEKDDQASRYAYKRLKDIIEPQGFNHDKFHPVTLLENGYNAVGENLGRGYNSAEGVVKAWMNSEGHKRNILNKRWKYAGIRAQKKGKHTYYVNIFGR